MLKRVEELSNDVKGKVHEVKKTLMLDFRERVEQLEQENASLRENLKERERVIDSMKGELDSFQISIRELREELRVKDALNSDDDQCEFLQPPP
jgi:chromosome segregation ATPase